GCSSGARVGVTVRSSVKMQTPVALLASPALFRCCSRALQRPVSISVLSRPGTQTVQLSGVSHLQLAHREFQPSTTSRDIDIALSSLVQVLPQLGWLVQEQVLEPCLAA
ncbi:unnamed protein product, partial [Lepidochelys olivacea]